MTETRTPPPSTSDVLVAPLDTVGAPDLDRAGGKGANLGELVRHGYRVPGGFVVTTDAYAAVVDHAGLASRIENHLASGAGAATREDFATVEIPAAVRAEILAAHATLGADAVAVRSSATAEDLPGAAFAGQQDTYLNVVGADAVLDAVRRCWGSLWTDRAIAYRERRGLDRGEVRIAVVVQEMVQADTAGVMLTANPVTGARDEIVLDASSGLGEAVVSGMVTPDHYVLGSDGTLRDRTPGQREVVIRSAAGGGVTHDTETVAAQPLPAAVLTELARLGTSVAEHFGRPQDIEWAHADGEVWLLQARPMTAVPPAPIRLNRIQRRTGPVIAELFPYRPYPLDMSAWIMPGPARLVERMMQEIPGLRVRFQDVVPEVDGVVEQFVPPSPRPTWRTALAPFRLGAKIRRFDPAQWRDDPRYATFERRVAELDAIRWEDASWSELSRVPHRAVSALDGVTDIRVDYLPRCGFGLLRLAVLLRLVGRLDLFASLLLGAKTRTQDTNRALEALAKQARDDVGLRTAFEELQGEELARRVREDAGFRAALDEFLAEYGHRETASALLMSTPTWRDDPATVLGAIKALTVERTGQPASDRSAQATQELLAARRPRTRARLRRAVQAARDGIAFREDTHFEFTRVLPALRRALMETGRRLATAGVLAERDDVLHLRLEELEGLPEPDVMSVAQADKLRDAVRLRSAKRDELAGVPLIAPATLFPDAATDADTLVSGTPAGGGRATGAVRIIHESTEFGTLRSGDILVCRYTNPSWTPLFQRAAAVVVDTGGLGSHAAIVAREYGIPAIMGSATATTTLTDGQRVTVDGDHGRVTAAADTE